MTETSRSYPPRGLDTDAAADYVGSKPTAFREMVKDGRMPPPKYINSKPVWDRLQLETAFDNLPQPNESDASNPWDGIFDG